MSDESTPSTPESGNSLLTSDPAVSSEPQAPAPEGEGQAEGQGEQKAEEQQGAPETYEFTLPDNYTVAPIMDDFKAIAKESGLSQDAAQKMVDLYVKAEQQRMENWQGIQKEWVETAKADKEYGGAKFNENITVAAGVINKYGTPELRKAMDDYGIGNHPEFIRFCVKVGKSMAEDNHVSGQASATKDADPAKTLYPNMK